jgi:Protein of unknown function (DUF2865)
MPIACIYLIGRLRRLCADHPVLAYGGFLATLVLAIGYSGSVLVGKAERPVAALMTLSDDKPGDRPVETSSAVLESDEWSQNIRTQFQTRGRLSIQSAPSGVGFGGDAAARLVPAPFGAPLSAPPTGGSRKGKASTTHRTMCVRLCDGYFFPISFATKEDRFEQDEATCARSCSSPAKLFVYENPGQEPENMVDLNGKPYSKLATAFRFRSKVDQSCKCAPHPWEQEAIDRHRKYAEDAARRKTGRQAGLNAAPAKPAKAGAGGSKSTLVEGANGAAGRTQAVAQIAGGQVVMLNVANEPAPQPASDRSGKSAAKSKANGSVTVERRNRPSAAFAEVMPRSAPATVVERTAPRPPLRADIAAPERFSRVAAHVDDWRRKVFASR